MVDVEQLEQRADNLVEEFLDATADDVAEQKKRDLEEILGKLPDDKCFYERGVPSVFEESSWGFTRRSLETPRKSHRDSAVRTPQVLRLEGTSMCTLCRRIVMATAVWTTC
jgi:hypothetical protein